jgi:long-subunit acyl-CoA synthetase (AMP-forming)
MRVAQVLNQTANTFGGRVALREKSRGAASRGSGMRMLTWTQVRDEARKVAKALIASKVSLQAPVAILGYNCIAWFLADVGAILAGALPFGIYATSSAEQCQALVKHAGAKIAFVENDEQAAKLRGAGIEVVQMFGASDETMAWDTFLDRAAGTSDAALEAIAGTTKETDACTLIYTSGTTGEPKAVMLTHENLYFEGRQIIDALGFGATDRSVSYLPMSHIAEQVLSIHAPMQLGSCVTFAESLDKAFDAVGEVKPTYFMGVPRVWEKLHAKIEGGLKTASPLKRAMFERAHALGVAAAKAKERGQSAPLGHSLADKLVLQKVRARLGLEHCHYAVTGAAPVSKRTLEFIWGLGIPVYEAYGMSESTGTTTISTPSHFRIGSVGRALGGTEVKIAEDGEICVRGKHVFAGYLGNKAATEETVNKDGWLHTGDIGSIDADGFIYVTDRKKELLITAGGENVAPAPIEGRLRSIPGVSQAVVIGDRKKYLIALITLDAEKLDVLGGALNAKMAEVASSAAAKAYLDAQIASINADLARVQTIKKHFIVAADFSIGDELTPTMKLKRKVILAKYKNEIDAAYGTGAD